MKYSLTPLTDRMIAQLKTARVLIINGEKQVPTSHFKYTLRNLHRRGFIEINTSLLNRKKVMGVVITEEGNSFLEHYQGA